MTNHLSRRFTQTAVAFFILSIVGLGSFITTSRAEAASVTEDTFPLLVSGAELALSAVVERNKPGALVNATIASEQKIAELMAALNQLMALYQSLLKERGVVVPTVAMDAASEDTDSKELDDVRPYYTIDITYPAGGESFVAGRHVIAIQYDTNIAVDEKRSIYLIKQGDVAVARQLVNTSPFNAGNLVRIDLAQVKLKYGTGEYKFAVCAPNVLKPTGGVTCGESNYFKIVGELVATSSVPYITKIKPEYVTPGSRVDVYGTNLYGNPIAIDGVFDTYGIQYPDTSGKSFSFVVPENLSAGKHKLSIEQKITGVPGNSVVFSVSGSISPTTPTVKVLSPNGGETLSLDESNMKITTKWESTNLSGVAQTYLEPSTGKRCALGKVYLEDESNVFRITSESSCYKLLRDLPNNSKYKFTIVAGEDSLISATSKRIYDSSDSHFVINVYQSSFIPDPDPIPMPPQPVLDQVYKSDSY